MPTFGANFRRRRCPARRQSIDPALVAPRDPVGVAAFFYRGLAQGQRPSVEDVQEYFRTFWRLETQHRPIRCGMKDTQESLLDLGVRMLAVVCRQARPGIEIVAVEQPFAVPLVDQETGGDSRSRSRGQRRPARARRRGAGRRRSQDRGAEVFGPAGRSVAAAVGPSTATR